MVDRLSYLKKNTPIVEVAQKLELNPKGYNGTQVINCLFHEDKHPSLVLMPDANRYECKSCSAAGSIVDLVMGAKKCTFKEAVEFIEPGFFSKAIKPIPENYLLSRGITQETADKFGLKVDSEKVTIPLPTGEKYRSLSGPSRYWHKSGTTDCLFKTKEATNKGVLLAEGELDGILTYQVTGLPVWSGTCGAISFKDEWVKDFEGIEKIYLAFDNDSAGDKGAIKAAEMLGFNRCYRVNIPKETGKDLTDFFISGKTKEDFRKLLLDSNLITQSSPAETKTALDYTTMSDAELDKIDHRRKLTTGLSKLDKVFTFPCGYYVICGNPGAGKGLFALWLSLQFYKLHNLRSAYFSLEMPEKLVRTRILQAWSGLTQKQHEDGWATDKAKALMKQGAIVVDEFGSDNSSYQIPDNFEKDFKKYYDLGFRIFHFDHLHELDGANDNDRNQRITELWSTKFQQICKQYPDVWLFIFAQPNGNAENKKVLRRSDLRGSKAITQKCEFFLSLNRLISIDESTGELKVSNANREVLFWIDKNRISSNQHTGTKIYLSETGNFTNFPNEDVMLVKPSLPSQPSLPIEPKQPPEKTPEVKTEGKVNEFDWL
ncbi:toprim domain-containing protein [Candidatus Daviesbacteria bacterium]|nr:toprim domain-containing protein [Candidatus Daviesbacteria bacterium]